MKIGYARVSTQEQNLDRQIDQLQAAGCERIYKEKLSGKNTFRPELERMLDTLREGDAVVITDLTRLSRSVKDLINISDKIHSIGADLISLKESWVDTTTAHGKLFFTIIAGFAELERNLIVERTMEGLKAARARGRNGGRPKVEQKKIKLALDLYNARACSVNEITNATGVSRTTLYRYIKNDIKQIK